MAIASNAEPCGDCTQAFLDELLAERLDQREFRLFNGAPFWEADPRTVYQHISLLEHRLEQSMAELATHGIGDSPLAQWFRGCPQTERPTAKEGRLMAAHFRTFPMEWTQEQGQWLLERIRLKDWSRFGPTQDEAILHFLGVQAVTAALGQGQSTALARLKSTYPQHFAN